MTREFKDVAGRGRQRRRPRRSRSDPPHADVTLRGPQRLLHNFELDDGASVDRRRRLPAGSTA